mmetsp:Transcript_3739/g.8943  ORF Transcript_3739/g.8943 Transcript_3739/m.8943 type:complete len:263 (+) Transcript_3739:3497-4285(+)
MVHVDNIGMGRKSFQQDPSLHGNLVIDVGMLSLGQIGSPLLFQNFQGKLFLCNLVCDNDNFRKISNPQGFSLFEFSDRYGPSRCLDRCFNGLNGFVHLDQDLFSQLLQGGLLSFPEGIDLECFLQDLNRRRVFFECNQGLGETKCRLHVCFVRGLPGQSGICLGIFVVFHLKVRGRSVAQVHNVCIFIRFLCQFDGCRIERDCIVEIPLLEFMVAPLAKVVDATFGRHDIEFSVSLEPLRYQKALMLSLDSVVITRLNPPPM